MSVRRVLCRNQHCRRDSRRVAPPYLPHAGRVVRGGSRMFAVLVESCCAAQGAPEPTRIPVNTFRTPRPCRFMSDTKGSVCKYGFVRVENTESSQSQRRTCRRRFQIAHRPSTTASHDRVAKRDVSSIAATAHEEFSCSPRFSCSGPPRKTIVVDAPDTRMR